MSMTTQEIMEITSTQTAVSSHRYRRGSGAWRTGSCKKECDIQ